MKRSCWSLRVGEQQGCARRVSRRAANSSCFSLASVVVCVGLALSAGCTGDEGPYVEVVADAEADWLAQTTAEGSKRE